MATLGRVGIASSPHGCRRNHIGRRRLRLWSNRRQSGCQAVERVVGIADLARDAADGLCDARAVAGGVERGGVVRQDGRPARVEEGAQAAGGVVGVGIHTVVGEVALLITDLLLIIYQD